MYVDRRANSGFICKGKRYDVSIHGGRVDYQSETRRSNVEARKVPNGDSGTVATKSGYPFAFDRGGTQHVVAGDRT